MKSKKVLNNFDFTTKPLFQDDLFKTEMETYTFSDEQIIRLLQKISNRDINQLALYFQNMKKEEIDYPIFKTLLNNICNELLECYGSKILSFIYQLPFFTNRENGPEIYKAELNLNIDMDDITFEAYKIPYENEYIYIELERIIRYEPFGRGKTSNKGYLTILRKNKNNSFYTLLARIKKDGTIDSEFLKDLNINLFSLITNDSIEVFSGSFEIRCRVCGRELTDPKSIYYGIGPGCATKL